MMWSESCPPLASHPAGCASSDRHISLYLVNTQASPSSTNASTVLGRPHTTASNTSQQTLSEIQMQAEEPPFSRLGTPPVVNWLLLMNEQSRRQPSTNQLGQRQLTLLSTKNQQQAPVQSPIPVISTSTPENLVAAPGHGAEMSATQIGDVFQSTSIVSTVSTLVSASANNAVQVRATSSMTMMSSEPADAAEHPLGCGIDIIPQVPISTTNSEKHPIIAVSHCMDSESSHKQAASVQLDETNLQARVWSCQPPAVAHKRKAAADAISHPSIKHLKRPATPTQLHHQSLMMQWKSMQPYTHTRACGEMTGYGMSPAHNYPYHYQRPWMTDPRELDAMKAARSEHKKRTSRTSSIPRG